MSTPNSYLTVTYVTIVLVCQCEKGFGLSIIIKLAEPQKWKEVYKLSDFIFTIWWNSSSQFTFVLSNSFKGKTELPLKSSSHIACVQYFWPNPKVTHISKASTLLICSTHIDTVLTRSLLQTSHFSEEIDDTFKNILK